MPPLARLLVATACLAALPGCTTFPLWNAGTVHWSSKQTLGVAELRDYEPQTPPLPDAAELPKAPGGLYRVGIGDDLTVTVWGRADLGSQLPVAGDTRLNISPVLPDGTISIPFLPSVPVEGKTTAEIRSEIARGYEGVLSKPQVQSEVARYRSHRAWLLGDVAKPGEYFLNPHVETVGGLIAAAGGLGETANGCEGVLTRDGVRYRVDYAAARAGGSDVLDVLLETGDRLFFPRATDMVYVFGEVYRPGTFPIPEQGMTLFEAIGLARGYDPMTARLKNVYLVRPEADGALVYDLPMKELAAGPDVALRGGDRILIPPSRMTIWERFWRQLLPFFSAGGNTGSVVRAATGF